MKSERSDTIQLFMSTKIVPKSKHVASSGSFQKPQSSTLHPPIIRDESNPGPKETWLVASVESKHQESDIDDYGIDQCFEPLTGPIADCSARADAKPPTPQLSIDQKHSSPPSSGGDMVLYQSPAEFPMLVNPWVSKCTAANDLRRRWRHQLSSGTLGIPASVVLTATRRKAEVQEDLRSNWRAEGVVCAVPARTTKRTNQFYPDVAARRSVQSRLESKGLIVFDTTTGYLPSAYVLPKLREGSPKNTCQPQSSGRSAFPRGCRNHETPYKVKASLERIDENGKDELGPQETQAVDSKPADKDDEISIVAPRFMEWTASETDDELENDTKQTTDYIERILQSVHDTLSDPERTGRAGAYKWVKGVSQDNMLKTCASLGIRSMKDENVILPKASGGEHSIPEEHSSKTHAQVDEQASGDTTFDPLHTELLTRCERATADLYRTFNEFLDCYLEPSYDHPLIAKSWGVVHIITSVSSVLHAAVPITD